MPGLSVLGRFDVHVYDFDLTIDRSELAQSTGYLDPRELAQADRFVTVALRSRYVASHGNLRRVLARYLDVMPREVRFVEGQHGKPRLDPIHASPIEFNLSHSAEKCLVAVTCGRPVGIDVERIRPLEDWQDIASRFFSEGESRRLAELPLAQTLDGFFATWSRKEAYIKALGLGLALDLRAFEVEISPHDEARLLWAANVAEGPEHWLMQDVPVDAGYRAAVAVRDLGCQISMQSLEGGSIRDAASRRGEHAP